MHQEACANLSSHESNAHYTLSITKTCRAQKLQLTYTCVKMVALHKYLHKQKYPFLQ